MFRLLRIVWEFIRGEGSRQNAIDMVARAEGVSSGEVAERIVNTVEKALEITKIMRREPNMPLSEIPGSEIFREGYVGVVRTDLGKTNPVQIETEIIDDDMSLSVDKVYDDIVSGRNYYGISPTIIHRILKYPESAKVFIDMLLPRIIENIRIR